MPIATPFDVGKLARLALHSGAQGARPEEVLLLRTAWKISFSTSSCMRTKCSGRTAMSWASRGTVRRNGRHGQHSFCWRTSSIASVPSTTKKEGVVSLYRKTRKKKCLFMVCCREHPAWWGALMKLAQWKTGKFKNSKMSYSFKRS